MSVQSDARDSVPLRKRGGGGGGGGSLNPSMIMELCLTDNQEIDVNRV